MSLGVKLNLQTCAVSLDGKRLVMLEGETSQEHDLDSPLGRLRVTWELYRPNFGNTIAIQTGELKSSDDDWLITFSSRLL